MKVKLDFVTNSSSSCFIINSSDEEYVKGKLEEIVKFYSSVCDTSCDYGGVFAEPLLSDGVEDWLDGYRHDYDSKDKVIVYSAYENSVPYIIAQILEECLQAEIYHLG